MRRQVILLRRNKINLEELGRPASPLNLRKSMRIHHSSLRQGRQFGFLTVPGRSNHWGRQVEAD
jgi:hypothetical protein